MSTEASVNPWIFLPYENAKKRSGVRNLQGKALRPAIIFTVDLLVILFSLVLAGNIGTFAVTSKMVANVSAVDLFMPQTVVGVIVTWFLLFLLTGNFQREASRLWVSTFDELSRTLGCVTVVAWILLVLLLTGGSANLAARSMTVSMVFFWILLLATIPAARLLVRNSLTIANPVNIPTLVAGAGEIGKSLVGRLERHREYGLNVIGFIDTDPIYDAENMRCMKRLGRPADLGEIIEKYGIKRVIIAFSRTSHQQILDMISQCQRMSVDVSIVPRYFGAFSYQSEIEDIEGLPIVTLPGNFRQGRVATIGKRSIDLTLAFLAAVILAPVFPAIAIMIKLDSRGPVLFSQKRMGLDGKVFRMYKYRSMIIDADEKKVDLSRNNDLHGPIFKIKEDPRVTRLGRLLRKLSLDELPQLINVFRGEMSLVGPRPLIVKEALQCKGEASQRHKVKPGITGLWQMLGRNEIPYEEMMQLDSFYVKNWSLTLDIKIIMKTFFTVLRKKGAY